MLPIRMCIACRKRSDKSRLIKITKPKDAPPCVDVFCNLPGRGAYLCKDRNCVQAAQKRRSLNRALRCEVDDDLYNQLHIIIDGGEQNGCQN